MTEFTIASLVAIFRKCVLYMVIVAIILGAGAYAFCTYVATPTYQTTVSFVATNKGFGDTQFDTTSKISSADIAASLAMLNTYAAVLRTGGLYEQIANNCGLSYSAREIASMVAIQARTDDSLFIDVRVISSDPTHSVKIANTVLDIGGDYVVEMIPNAYLRGVEYSKSASKNYPNTPFTILLCSFFGAVFVYVAAMIINAMDKTIKGEKDFNNNYDIPILGNIPNFKVAAREEKK